jgi:hypothetical protein
MKAVGANRSCCDIVDGSSPLLQSDKCEVQGAQASARCHVLTADIPAKDSFMEHFNADLSDNVTLYDVEKDAAIEWHKSSMISDDGCGFRAEGYAAIIK